MAEERNVFKTTLLICPLEFQPQADEAFMVDGRKHTHKHTHTQVLESMITLNMSVSFLEGSYEMLEIQLHIEDNKLDLKLLISSRLPELV